MKLIKYASKLLNTTKKAALDIIFNASGLSDLEKATTRDDKVLNIILSNMGYTGSALSIDDIVKMNYSGGTTWLEYYPAFVINKALDHRNILYKSRAKPEITLPEKLNYIARFDANLEVPLKRQKKHIPRHRLYQSVELNKMNIFFN